ncbi:bifunctional diaminohydroxyphosphoribosylaminopyrimidine deaminase/5-amino-6-(5-phosphoribosylamino)uracil reductase RibD [Peptoniphilus raoultii]|uniref:bifunctional diaminohydroxyphosphoribosylaminopyrimidine deaminase/5-amino-6-(5-phosphoribosylamino)uracil reductase RibD n=1 Tax=Peptoniphilus raoultii TaxID=1776387 RepID=UPI0008D930E6|nr:bifunctional diaminohydroxyphosphoribosylaminopyrimidine deaminase/5-amino-6-(5-phosphoribosylamino)uracil reductase RibD [Peptoniphilus raoultii]
MLDFYDYSFYMERCLELAKKGRGFTKTNPMVGCVIVKDDQIIAEGYHKKFGGLHAERDAINNAKEPLEGAELYVSLEPCCHFGKQPPCTQAIIDAKISKVIIGAGDPNPKVAGKGIKILEDAGIEVVEGILEEESIKLNKIFFHNLKYKRPYVTLKAAMSIDGKIAASSGESQWISSERSREYAHKLRGVNDGIMVGIGTVLADNPSLNVRIEGGYINPTKIVVDSRLRIPEDAKLFSSSEAQTIIYTSEDYDREKFKRLSERENVKIIVGRKEGESLNLKYLLEKLLGEDIGNILLEGGPGLSYSMLKEDLIDELIFFMAPKLIGGQKFSVIGGEGFETLTSLKNVYNMTFEKIGPDLMVQGYLRKGD